VLVTATRKKKADIGRAKISPANEFAAPADVAHDRALDHADKKKILKQWRTDADALNRAADEGMSGGEPARLDEVENAERKIGIEKK
jgi:hypothetical protein